MGVPAITVQELKKMMDRGDAFVLVDVREPHEVAISQLPASLKIPLGSLPGNVSKLSTADAIVVHCRSGARSARAVQFLMASGFGKVWNLTGGIDLWAVEIDPTVPRY
jgi:adenylyltransferase/sulfurtransferase